VAARYGARSGQVADDGFLLDSLGRNARASVSLHTFRKAEFMNRTDILDAARQAVTVDRAATHGQLEDSFGLVAAYWSAHLGTPVSRSDVAVMMIQLKLARIKTSPEHADHWIDVAGYAACGGEVAVK